MIWLVDLMRLEVLGLVALVLYAALLCCVAFWAFWRQSELSRRSKAHQLFLLRDALSRRPGASDFYAGQVACAFNETTICEEKFKKVLTVRPKSAVARRIHQILAAAALREGRYVRALHEIDALLAIDPKNTDANAARPLIEVLSHFPDQGVQAGAVGKVMVQMDDGRVPLLINGKPASYLFDSGANLSVLSESEALRLGMEIQEFRSDDASRDINGNRVLFRISVAKTLALGGIQLSNVAFLVADHEQQPFADMHAGQRGLLGLPVLQAFGSVTWTRDGVFEADWSPVSANLSEANICFDDLDLITQARFEQHVLSFVLDTGAENSDLWPKFARVARHLIRKSGSPGFRTVTGMGGAEKFEITSVPKVVLQLGGESVALQPAHILKAPQKSDREWFYGLLGIDVLRQAYRVTIDFRTMTLQLDGAERP